MQLTKILVVDDNQAEFFIIKDLFEKNSKGAYSINWSANKEQALKLISDNQYDAYIIDYKLGRDNGIDLIKEAKATGCGAPFLLLTGYREDYIDKQAQELGVDEYIVKKDLNFFDIEKSIRYALERKKVERVFVEHQSKLLKSIKMSILGELVSGVAHEINNPLALLSVLASNMKKRIQKGKFDADTLVGLIEKVEEVVGRMNKITNSLTKYSRGKGTDPFEKSPLYSLVEESLEICMGKIRAKRIKIEVIKIPEDLYVFCRPGEVVQVIVNLINNAVDAISHQNHPWIKIEVYKDAQFFNLYITDSGEGISDSIKEQIYTPFFTTKQSDGGTGLGLSISKSIIEAHSGKIKFYNSPEGNTQVVVSFPSDKSMLKLKEHKVLIVDSNIEMRDLLASILQEKNCKVFLANSYDEALQWLGKEPGISKLVTDASICRDNLMDYVHQIESLRLKSDLSHALIFNTHDMNAKSSFIEREEMKLFVRPFNTTDLIDFCIG